MEQWRIEKLTCSTARATLSIRHGGVGTGDQWAGDLAAYGGRVLQRGGDSDKGLGHFLNLKKVGGKKKKKKEEESIKCIF